MHKSATKCNETLGKWCKNKHGASKIIDTFWTYQLARLSPDCSAQSNSSNTSKSFSISLPSLSIPFPPLPAANKEATATHHNLTRRGEHVLASRLQHVSLNVRFKYSIVTTQNLVPQCGTCSSWRRGSCSWTSGGSPTSWCRSYGRRGGGIGTHRNETREDDGCVGPTISERALHPCRNCYFSVRQTDTRFKIDWD
jgi:hypothetical protein